MSASQDNPALRVLRLNLKGKWWEQIANGEKQHELRRNTGFWQKRLAKEYDEIHLCLGYPKRGDTSRTLRRKWVKQPEVHIIVHEEFFFRAEKLFVIDVSQPVGA